MWSLCAEWDHAVGASGGNTDAHAQLTTQQEGKPENAKTLSAYALSEQFSFKWIGNILQSSIQFQYVYDY